jgi:hypothetical protein
MKERSFRNTRLWKGASRARERLGGRVRARFGRRVPEEIEREYVRGCFIGLMHEVGMPFFRVVGGLSNCRDFVENDAIRERFADLTEKASRVSHGFAQMGELLDSANFYSLVKSRGFKANFASLLKQTVRLKQEIEAVEKEMPKEDPDLRDGVSGASRAIGMYINYMAEFKARRFSFSPIIEKIRLGAFAGKIADEVVNSHPLTRRIPVSVEIPQNLAVLMGRLDLRQCIRLAVGNSIEHNPGRPLKITATSKLSKDSLWIYIDFLTGHAPGKPAKPFPPQVVEGTKPFYSSTGNPERGRGIYIMSKIIERYGSGTLEAENTPDGPRFRMGLSIPRKQAERMKLF